MTASAPSQDRPLYALGLRLFAISGFSMMSVLIKLASEAGVGLGEIVFWRQALALPLLVVVIWHGPGFSSLRTSRFPAHAARSIIGLTCMALNFACISLLPLAESTTLGFAAPIFATILSALIFKESVGPRRALAVAAGFAGVIIVAQPSGHDLNMLGVSLGLSAAMLVAFVSFQIRDLGRTEASLTIVFWFTALSTAGLLLLLPFVWQNHGWQAWLLLLGVGTLGGISQIAMTTSLRHAPVSALVGMDYISLVWSTLAGWLIWSQLPTGQTWAGAAIIVASGLYIAWREHRLSLERSREIAA